MPASGSQFCDVALPVPLDKSFTYTLPAGAGLSAQAGCRVVVPFGPRRLTGVILRCHGTPPESEIKEVMRLLDEQPALSEELLRLGRWIASYYCAPLGVVLRTMLPVSDDTRTRKVVSLTPGGVLAARQFNRPGSDDPSVNVLRALENRPLTATYLRKKVPGAAGALGGLERKRLLSVESVDTAADGLAGRGGRLMVEAGDAKSAPSKLTKGERWLLDYVRTHAGPHDVQTLREQRRDVATVARRLAKLGAIRLWKENTEVQRAAEAPGSPVTLNRDQENALNEISSALRGRTHGVFLMSGVTGSGKTEVYLRAIEQALASGRSSLLLVPEIALTPAVASQFFARFGDQVAILHSAFSGLQRSAHWRRIREGKARVVVGTRSAVFAPVEDLGLVIVDEEHETSYKQEETPRYHGRDVAIVRAKAAGAVVVLGSATPSLESRYNVERGKYRLLEMPERIERRPLPEVDVIDMRAEFVETGRQDLFSRVLQEAIREKLDAGEQVMMLLNRRGFSAFVACRQCGERVECENCSLTLTYHRRDQALSCHYCDYSRPVPSVCPKCESEYIYFIGSGSEKVEDYLRRLYPRARIARLDRDTACGRASYETILQGFREKSYDILVGTQMIAKGHDIPNVTLVGVVSADIALGMPDVRAAERTFQLLTQVAGRAGRGERPGRVFLQTLSPDHYAIRFAAAQDYEGFYKKEIHFRRMLHYPPIIPMATLVVRSKKLEEALALSGRLGRHLRPLPEGVRMLGPAAAPVVKLKKDYRYQFIFKAPGRKVLSGVLHRARQFAEDDNWPATALVIDVDPVNLM